MPIQCLFTAKQCPYDEFAEIPPYVEVGIFPSFVLRSPQAGHFDSYEPIVPRYELSPDGATIGVDGGQTMEYKIEIEEHAGQRMIHTRITGTLSDKDRNRIGLETVGFMRDNNISKVIWDIREAPLDYALIYSHLAVLNLAALGVRKGDYVAVIYFHNKEHHQHAQNVAFNRGVINVNYFQNIEEGIQWLTDRE